MKRECRAIRRALHAYLDGELPPDRAERVHTHTLACAECGEALRIAAATRDLLRSQPEPEAPPGLAAAIKARAHQELAQPVRVAFDWRRAVVPVAAAAGLILALAITLNLARRPSAVEVAEAPAPVVETSHTAPDLAPAEITEPPAADAQVQMTPVAESSAPRRRPVHAARSEESAPPAEDATAEAEGDTPTELALEPTEIAPARPAEVAFAFAHEALPPVPVRTGTVVAPAPPETGEMVAWAPRLSRVTDTLRAEESVEAATPFLADELATGVVAGMLLNKFIEDHLIDTTSTLLAVTTGTPSEDLGTAVVTGGGDGDRFSLCFTQAMRRALAQVQE